MYINSEKDNNCFTSGRHSDCLPALSRSSTNNDNCCNGNGDVVNEIVDRIVFRGILKSMREKKRNKNGRIEGMRHINEYTLKEIDRER